MARVKYLGLTSVINVYGNWKPGEVKEVPDGIKMIGFEEVKVVQQPKKKKKVNYERTADKMERDNVVVKEEEK